MLRLNLYYLLKFRLVEIFPRILKYILGFFLKHFEQKDRDHVLEFRVLTQIGFIINSVLHLFLIQKSHLGCSEALDAGHIVRVIVLLFVVHVVYLIAVDMVFV